jgi:hypothetical protein
MVMVDLGCVVLEREQLASSAPKPNTSMAEDGRKETKDRAQQKSKDPAHEISTLSARWPRTTPRTIVEHD